MKNNSADGVNTIMYILRHKVNRIENYPVFPHDTLHSHDLLKLHPSPSRYEDNNY